MPQTLSNILRRPTLINTADNGLQHGYPSNSNTAAITGQNTIDKELVDLTDRRRVNRTIENAREAMEIDPTVFSSILSMTIVTNSEFKIVGDEDADDNAIEHIKEKIKPINWDLSALMDETLIKSMVDSKCFIRTWPNQENPNTLDVDMLAYDEKDYNFIELVNPYTGELLGYKQKATIYPVPDNWETQSFETLADREAKEDEANFMPEAVIQPKFLERDGKADSLVFKALDYVDIKREIENMIPPMVRRASLSLGIQVGDKDADLGITSEEEAQQAVDNASTTFKEKEKKDVIAYMFGMKPEMIGNGQMPNIIPILNYVKQEIRSALLTPDSRFESASSNRAVAEEQLSGSMGQVNTIEYLQSWLKKYFEYQLINRELQLAGFQNDIGKVHIKFTELEVENDLTNAQIAQILESAYPSTQPEDADIRINTYFKPYAIERQKQGIKTEEIKSKQTEGQTSLEQFQNLFSQNQQQQQDPTNPDEEPLTNAIRTGHGYIQPTLKWSDSVNKARKILIKEGVLS